MFLRIWKGCDYFCEIVPSQKSRKRIKAKIKTDRSRRQAKKKGKKIPMESNAYPGEFFFFVCANELLHGLGSRMAIEMAYLGVHKPYAEHGLLLTSAYNQSVTKSIPPTVDVKDTQLNEKLQTAIKELQDAKKVEGVQFCAIDKNGDYLAN